MYHTEVSASQGLTQLIVTSTLKDRDYIGSPISRKDKQRSESLAQSPLLARPDPHRPPSHFEQDYIRVGLGSLALRGLALWAAPPPAGPELAHTRLKQLLVPVYTPG